MVTLKHLADGKHYRYRILNEEEIERLLTSHPMFKKKEKKSVWDRIPT